MSKFFPAIPFGLGKGAASSSSASGGAWVPGGADGTLLQWVDATDNDTLTIVDSKIAASASKAGSIIYSQSEPDDRPGLTTINGLQAFSGTTGSQRLNKEGTTAILNNSTKFLIGFAVYLDSATTLRGLFYDGGDGVASDVHIGFSTHALWQRIFVTSPAGGEFSPISFDASNPATTGLHLIALEYDGVNNGPTGWTCTVNGSTLTPSAGNNLNDSEGTGAIMDFGQGYCFSGGFGEMMIIGGHSSRDTEGMLTYFQRWGTP